MQTAHIAARVPPEMKARLEELATEEGKTCSEILKELVARRFAVSGRAADSAANAEPSSPGLAVSFDLLIDETIRCQEKLLRIEALVGDGDPPEHLVRIRKICQLRLTELSEKLKTLEEETGVDVDDLPDDQPETETSDEGQSVTAEPEHDYDKEVFGWG